MTDLAQKVFDGIGRDIEKMPTDGRTCEGTTSEILREEQRAFVAGMRYARFKAHKIVSESMEAKE